MRFNCGRQLTTATVPQLPVASALGELVVAVTREGRLSGKFLAKVRATNNVHICPVQPQVCTSIVAANALRNSR